MDIGQINTLSKFLRQSGAQYRVFDMGRRVCKLTPEQFVSFDNCQRPYPYPFKRLAQMGIIFWHPEMSEKQYVWFLQFPLDEQGLLVPDARDAFLLMLLERLGEAMLAAADGEKIQGALRDSPYTFKPRQDRMAAFNAQATYTLKLAPSKYYDTAYRYFTGDLPLDKWPGLAMQGLADFAIRLDTNEGTLGLIQTLPKLPEEPFHNLCVLLEHACPAAGVIEVLAQQVDIQLQEKQPDTARIISCLRAASNSPARGLVERMVTQVLKHRCSKEIEVLAIISGRIWLAVAKPAICALYLEQLALNDAGQPGFSQLLADLLFIPGMREPVMQALRNPKRSESLAKSVGEMFGH
ncbi:MULTISPECIES: DUF3549 family protein [unclassified Methylophaga]|uniref:DUF3549 family protein n=1 Tax=unclassified Methylophaga TaxID=2629249 RepID=UPI000C9766B9|nr:MULTISPECIES: DUF3549 family protein [unclassified Methylophaga]MBN47206.1 hypothetical protein [Methylophaga sp.]HAD32316.1 DUF3549 domain-containing protein [Methylophaga sp.]|tara:strand:- start:2236 stop:3288 length:1053 start_codon:yes stop_codon:yes gene_type:complete